MKRIKFRLAAYTDAAGRRNDVPPLYGNEDNFFVDADLSNGRQGEFVNDEQVDLSDCGSLMVIADGMGGMNAGEVASEIAISTVKKRFAPDKLPKNVASTSKSREHYMESVVAEADAAIKTHARENVECEGMGSTIIMVWLCGGEASLTWCGDSRAYLFRENVGLRQISKDHSYVQSLVDEGKITEDEAFDHPYGNVVTRSLGDPEKHAQTDSLTIPIYKGDIILLCSDGLSGVLRDRKSFDKGGNPREGDNIEDIIRNNRASMRKCREVLWEAAEKSGWYDNVTAILCEITEGEPLPKNLLNPQQGPRTSSNFYFIIRKKTVLCAVIVLCVLALLVVGFFLMKPAKHTVEPDWDGVEALIDSRDFSKGETPDSTHNSVIGGSVPDSIVEDWATIVIIPEQTPDSDTHFDEPATSDSTEVSDSLKEEYVLTPVQSDTVLTVVKDTMRVKI